MLETSTRDDITLQPDIAAAVRETAALIERLGHQVEISHPAALEDEELLGEFLALWAAGAAASIDRIGEWIGRPIGREDVEPATWAMAEGGRDVSGPDVLRMQAAQMKFRRHLATWWADGFDLLLTATCMRTAPELGELASTDDDPIRGLISSIPYAINAAPFNVSGQPAMSLPLALSEDGLPIGIQLVADYGREDLLFQIAGQLEEEIDWSATRSPLHP